LIIFCTREGIDFQIIRNEAAGALREFLDTEVADVDSKKRSSCINCSQAEIEELAISLGVSLEECLWGGGSYAHRSDMALKRTSRIMMLYSRYGRISKLYV
jgi:hypothetical protein